MRIYVTFFVYLRIINKQTNTKVMETSTTYTRKSGNVTQTYKLVTVDVNEFMECQHAMAMQVNVELGTASQVTLF